MHNKFLVQIAFVIDKTEEFSTEDRLRYFIEENGYVYFRGELRDENNNTVNDVMIDGSAITLNVHEI